MNTEHLAAFWAATLFFFGFYESSYAEFSNVLEIAYHAHAILGSISLIQMTQPGTREAVTAKAVIDFRVTIFSQFLISSMQRRISI